MQLNLNPDVACWIDANRGELSRQKFILTLVKKMMLQDTQSTKDNNGKNNLPNGAFYAPVQE
jgi:hypothetical protein